MSGGDILLGGGGGGSVHYENVIKGEGGVKTYNCTQIMTLFGRKIIAFGGSSPSPCKIATLV